MPEFIKDYLDYVLVAFFWLFIAFVFVMKVKYKIIGTAWEKPLNILLGWPFLVFDCFVNYIISPLFFDAPAHWFELVTGRMKRYKQIKKDEYSASFIKFIRYHFAWRLCRLLNQYDKDHC